MSLRTWGKRVEQYRNGEPIPITLISALCSKLRSHIFTKRTEAQIEEVCFLEQNACYQYGNGPAWAITPTQKDKGLKWLRRSNVHRYMGIAELRIIADFDHFTFEGVWMNWTGMRVDTQPVYRVHSKSLEFFDYTATAWQQGSKSPFRILRTFSKEV